MKKMIQIAILAAMVAPTTTFAKPHGGKAAPAPSVRVPHGPKAGPAPAPRTTPVRRPPPTPGPSHHRHHHHLPLVAVATGATVVNYPVARAAQPVVFGAAMQPSGERPLTPREFLNARERFVGQRVVIFGRVTQAIRGNGGLDYYILDGIVRCELPRDVQSTNGVQVGTGHLVTIAGLGAGSWNGAASADLVECSHAF